MPVTPTWDVVRMLFEEGYTCVAGVDEVGRGAWAGPVAVGIAAVTPAALGTIPAGVRDSKLLAEAARERLFEPLAQWCPSYAIGEATPGECDRLGMTGAQRLAAGRALEHLGLDPDVLVVDGNLDYTGHPAARTLVRGDETCMIVAAASVLAKVTRDRQMIVHGGRFPAYGFARNKGYVSAEHRRAVGQLGMTDLHRRSWSVACEPGVAERGGRGRARL